MFKALVLGLALGLIALDASAQRSDPVLFVSNRDSNAQIYRMQADGSGQRALTRGPAENTEPAWSPDGSRIAFTSYRDGNGEIYVMDADGSRQTRLSSHASADNAPAWLPDGRIVFRSMRNRWSNFYVMNADGSGVQALTADEVDKGPPLVSPDGRHIAFVAHGPSGSSDIRVMPAAGGPARDLTSALSKNPKSAPAWSPDGSRLAYVESKGVALNVMVVGADGDNAAAITDNAYTNAHPVWSPDGRHIAFVSGREGTRTEMARGDIYVMAADGSAAINLTRHPGEDNFPAWAADGSAIYFVSLRDGNAQIYAVPWQGGQATRLTRNAGHDLVIRPLAASAASAQPDEAAHAAVQHRHMP